MTTPPPDEATKLPDPSAPTCPSCGGAIPADAPRGLCPACLAAATDETLPAGPRSGPLAFTVPDVAELDALLDGFEVSEMIGRGGMGAVYKARQIKLDRTVAIKVLPESIASDAAFAERFSREARALAKLSHPNIVHVHDVETTDGGLCYIVMEYVEGANLRDVLKSGRLSPGEALAIVVQICEALQYAHDAGVVHRDIKPDNILITEKGVVKIADFGLVKLIGGNSPDFDVTLTATHQAMGTVQYMAPEQLSGSVEADHRADIYSLGVVFYEMLTGEIPAGRFDPPSQRVQVDVRLDEVVLRALDGQPDRRYQSAGDIRSEVETIQASGGGSDGPPPLPGREATTSVKEFSSPGGEPRFSRKAIVGALWAPLAFVALFMMFAMMPARVEPSIEGAGGPQAGESLVNWVALGASILLGIPGLLAPIGTTVLGLIAISDIRHSRGKVIGLPLALADALLFPLILLWILCVGLVVWLQDVFGPDRTGDSLQRALVPGLLLAVVIGFFIVRAAWRAASKPVAPN